MEIKKLFERDAAQTTEAARRQKIDTYQEQQKSAETVQSTGEDRVTISTLSRQLNQIAKVVEEDEAQRRDRVAQLKEQVENGTYKVDSQAVARSLISFAADTEDLA